MVRWKRRWWNRSAVPRHICLAGALGLILAWAGLSGCGVLNSKGAGVASAETPAADRPFAPVAMRFHPFTAIGAASGADQTLIEARLTFHDRWDHTTKTRGTLRFELALLDDAGRSDPARRQRINTWDADLTPLDRNARHFDGMTRTYLFKLRLPQTVPAGRTLLLTAQFNAPDGRRLHARTELTPGDE